MEKPTLQCIISSSYGIYIPQRFAELHRGYLKKEDYDDLMAGPEGEFYWETWANVLDNTKVAGMDLYQNDDGDVFYVPQFYFVDDEGNLQPMPGTLDEFINLAELAENICLN